MCGVNLNRHRHRNGGSKSSSCYVAPRHSTNTVVHAVVAVVAEVAVFEAHRFGEVQVQRDSCERPERGPSETESVEP